MTVPPEYERASSQFYDFLEDARDFSQLHTTNQAYTMVQGVLQAFRRRLSVEDAILFANALPLLLRALFVSDWNPREPQVPFTDRATMTEEVKSLRRDHNFAPDQSIPAVARALKKHAHPTLLDDVLSKLPAGAVDFWET